MKRLVILGAMAVAALAIGRRLARGCEGLQADRHAEQEPEHASEPEPVSAA